LSDALPKTGGTEVCSSGAAVQLQDCDIASCSLMGCYGGVSSRHLHCQFRMSGFPPYLQDFRRAKPATSAIFLGRAHKK
jgi:hypothetical protein